LPYVNHNIGFSVSGYEIDYSSFSSRE